MIREGSEPPGGMCMVETEHIDPTALGLYLVAVVSLPLALANLWFDGPVTDVTKYYPLLGLMIIACVYFETFSGMRCCDRPASNEASAPNPLSDDQSIPRV